MKPDQPPTCPQAEQAIGWALHALEPAEEVGFAFHVRQCDTCAAQVGQAEELLATLGAAEAAVDPPPSLRSALLARIAETPQQPRIPAGSAVAESVPTGAHPTSDPAGLSSVPPRPPAQRSSPLSGPDLFGEANPSTPRSARRLGRHWLVLAAAALAVIVGVGGLVIRNAQVEQQRDAATSQAQQLASALSELRKPGVQHAMLAAPYQDPVAAVLVVDGERKLITVGLPANSSAENTYVLWGTGAGIPRPLVTFDVATPDSGRHSVGPVTEVDRFTGYAISLEPGRNAPGSPSTVLASGQVQL